MLFHAIERQGWGCIGVVASRIDVKTLNELMLSLKLGKTDETYLVNKDGLHDHTESGCLQWHLKEMDW